jgi:molecular chaperone Hsp33
VDAPHTDDLLTRFVFEGAAVRGALVTLSDASRSILASHPYPPALQRVLAELCAAATLLASTLKFTGSLVVQLQGGGPVRLLVVECTDALHLRATAQWDADRVRALGDDATLAELAGHGAGGRLVITLDPKGTGAIYQGIVALETASVAHLIEHYLQSSEQLASRMVLTTREGMAAGMLVQRMPQAESDDDETWTRTIARMGEIDPAALLQAEPSPQRIHALFPHDDVRVFAGKPVRNQCRCSRERVENALRIAGQAEIESILAERGDVEVSCEFCGLRYVLGPVEARALFAPAPASTAH